MTRPALRCALAVLVTIAASAAASWVCDTLVLPVRDSGMRWGIAGGLGVAVAALAALWRHSYASAEEQQLAAEEAHAVPAGTGRTSNTTSLDVFHEPVIQGRDISTISLTGPATAEHSRIAVLHPDNDGRGENGGSDAHEQESGR